MPKLLLIIALLCVTTSGYSQTNITETPKEGYEYFLDFFKSVDSSVHDAAIAHIDNNWSESFEILSIETLYFLRNAKLGFKLLLILQQNTGKEFGYDFNSWFEYQWKKPPTYNPSYFNFKAALHKSIDFRFVNYFLNREQQATIRLDEVRWGGVEQDGIPPLRNPKMIAPSEADYLEDDNIVFGISINGEARAYPKRILAWHEMFTDTVGDTPVAGVYCTLCGTVILYKTQYGDTSYHFGTSGFLYRSNKLMYDKKTQSLWNTLWGTPVIGPLVNKGIQLEYLNVVTTTWGAWKKLHPETTVLSTNTGHQRNYGEGVAYKEYFADDELMFNVPAIDSRLKNKQEILAIRLPLETDESIAISSKFLRKNRIYTGRFHRKSFTVFTDKSGAHRVYYTQDKTFVFYDKGNIAKDADGVVWNLFEDRMENEITKEVLAVFPAHNAFWFGFKAAFPQTTLIK